MGHFSDALRKRRADVISNSGKGALLAMALLLMACLPAWAEPQSQNDAQDPLVIAILEFEAVNDEAKIGNKGRMVSEMLTTAAVKQGLQVVERHMIRKIMDEMEFGDSGFSGTDAQKIGVVLGAKAVLSGSVSEFLGQLRIDARLVNVTDGTILLADGAQAQLTLDSIAAAVQSLMRKMVAVLKPGAQTAQEPEPAPQSTVQPPQTVAPQPAPEPAVSAAPTLGKLWTEQETGMHFAFIPGGCFSMGSPANEPGRDKDEPLRQECVNDFWIGLHEVTKGSFQKFVDATGYVTDAERDGFSWGYNGKTVKLPGQTWKNTLFMQDTGDPVVNVSWNDAQAFCAWLSKRTGLFFRLPTEAEWEYACRGGTQGRYFWGDSSSQACTYANVHDQTSRRVNGFSWQNFNCDDGVAQTASVGIKRPNPFGLYDMLGNVWEWCRDTDSQTGRHIARGGSWDDHMKYVRCANRDKLRPNYRIYSLGFRVVWQP